FGGVEGPEGLDLGDDLAGVFFFGRETGDLVLYYLFFLWVPVESYRPVLCAFVRALAVEFSRVHRSEECPHERGEGYLRGVVIHLDRFGVTSGAGADLFIIGVGVGASAVAGDRIADAFEALEDDIGMPEAPFGEIGDGLFRAGLIRSLDGDIDGLCLAAGGQQEKAKREDERSHG